MTQATTELAARDLAEGITLPLERRYPLDLDCRAVEVYAKYHESNAAMWDVDGDVAWAAAAVGGSPEERRAAALVWSWQAWVAFGDITTSEAALVRSCLDVDVAADLKFCIATRATERAAAADAGTELAGRLDRYVAEPPTAELAALFAGGMVRRVLHGGVDLDALLVAHFALVPTVDRAVAEARFAAAGNGAVCDLLGHVVTDLRRQEAWAWADLSARLPGRSEADRFAIIANLADVLSHDLLLGARWTAVIDPAVPGAGAIAAAEELAAAAGLGGVTRSDQRAAVVDAFREVIARCGAAGLPTEPIDAVLGTTDWWT